MVAANILSSELKYVRQIQQNVSECVSILCLVLEFRGAKSVRVFHYTYMSWACCASIKSAQNFFEVILCVRWQCISSGINTDRCTTWYVIVEFDVGRFRLIKLHIPIAVRRYLLRQLLSKCNLWKSGSVWWKTARWKCSCTWIESIIEKPEREKKVLAIQRNKID